MQKEDRAERETDALNEQVYLYGFIDPRAFLTNLAMSASFCRFVA